MGQALVNSDAVFYGKFVEGAYAMYKRDPSNLRPEPAVSDIPDTYEFVAWIHMSDFSIDEVVPKFYGIVARDKSTRREFVLAIRGTEGAIEWFDDAACYLVPFSQMRHTGRVAHGFDRVYSTMKIEQHPSTAGPKMMQAGALPELQGSFGDQLEQLHLRLESVAEVKATVSLVKGRPERPYIVTGHSLGAALTTLFVMENEQKKKFDISNSCTFASPRVGNMDFVRAFNALPIASWRIVNRLDLVPKLPIHIPIVLDFEHVNTAYEFSSKGMVKANAVCWHSIETYLHLLDASQAVLQECMPTP
jgi:triacylglycerol lipase